MKRAGTRGTWPHMALVSLMGAAGCVPDVVIVMDDSTGGAGATRAAQSGGGGEAGGDNGLTAGAGGVDIAGGGAGDTMPSAGAGGMDVAIASGGAGGMDIENGGAGGSIATGGAIATEAGRGGMGTNTAGTAGNEECAGAVPPLARHSLLIADYNAAVPPAPPEDSACIDGEIRERVENDGLDCRKPVPNLLRHCAGSTFCGENGGAACLRYEIDADLVLGGAGRSLRLDFDVERGPDVFSGYLEQLGGPGDQCGASAPLDLEALNLASSEITFWIRLEPGASVPKVEIALKSDGAVAQTDVLQTAPKRLLESYFENPCGCWQDGWVKICIPADDLLFESGTKLDVTAMLELSFAFVNGSGTLLLDDIAFEGR